MEPEQYPSRTVNVDGSSSGVQEFWGAEEPVDNQVWDSVSMKRHNILKGKLEASEILKIVLGPSGNLCKAKILRLR